MTTLVFIIYILPKFFFLKIEIRKGTQYEYIYIYEKKILFKKKKEKKILIVK
jgi:hypothetical protein